MLHSKSMSPHDSEMPSANPGSPTPTRPSLRPMYSALTPDRVVFRFAPMPKTKTAKPKKHPVPAAKSASPAKTNGAAPTQSKADFVRSQPPGLSAREILAKAKEAGISIGENYVYALRPAGKKMGSKRAPVKPAAKVASKSTASKAIASKRSAAPKAGAPSASVPIRASSRETDFARLVLDLGFERVDALLTKIKRTVGSLTAGA